MPQPELLLRTAQACTQAAGYVLFLIPFRGPRGGGKVSVRVESGQRLGQHCIAGLLLRGGSRTGGVERMPRSHRTLSFCISVCTVASGAPSRFCSACAQQRIPGR